VRQYSAVQRIISQSNSARVTEPVHAEFEILARMHGLELL
jgi:rRNA-processing protein FCF1